VSSLRELITNASDYAQERLVNLLEGKFSPSNSSQSAAKDNQTILNNISNNNYGLEKLSSNDFISLSNLIDQFIIDFDQIAYNNTINNNMNKKSSSLRIWLQNQANKFLHKFHSEKKDKLTLALNSERWKQIEIPIEIQNLIDHIIKNGLGSNQLITKKADAKSHNASNGDYILVNHEKYIIFGTVIVLIKLMVEYCQYVIDIPNMSFDALNRVIELFKTFNAKSYQMILGAGAVDQKVLKLITFKTLALTYRSLELILVFLPILKDFFRDRISQDKHTTLEKQFNQLIKDYNEHKLELNNKLIFMIDDIFRDLLSKYEVIAPVPSQCFRSICQQLLRIHEITSEIFNDSTLVKMFTEIHSKFKQRLGDRLKELNVVNDGGPQHA
jgi:vacuolar protein sorting-associated protein 54